MFSGEYSGFGDKFLKKISMKLNSHHDNHKALSILQSFFISITPFISLKMCIIFILLNCAICINQSVDADFKNFLFFKNVRFELTFIFLCVKMLVEV